MNSSILHAYSLVGKRHTCSRPESPFFLYSSVQTKHLQQAEMIDELPDYVRYAFGAVEIYEIDEDYLREFTERWGKKQHIQY